MWVLIPMAVRSAISTAAPGGGGRIGWFYPWKPHYDLELGVSGMAGQWDTAGSLLWSAAVVDAALHVSPYVEVKGEYIYTWQQTADLGNHSALRAGGSRPATSWPA